jgi:hypothetical protein
MAHPEASFRNPDGAEDVRNVCRAPVSKGYTDDKPWQPARTVSVRGHLLQVDLISAPTPAVMSRLIPQSSKLLLLYADAEGPR